MKKLLLTLLFLNWVNIQGFAEYSLPDTEEATYELLVNSPGDAGGNDFIPHFRKLFKNLKVRTLFEFGMGFRTNYFLDTCTKVISVEFVTHGYGPSNYLKFLNFYRDYANWIPVVYFSGFQGDASFAPYKYMGSESVYKAASYQCATHKDYSQIDDFYLTELSTFISNFVKFHKIDVAFVNSSGVYNRGDLVQRLFGKVPVIVAVDTNVRAAQQVDDLYGYSRLVTPEEYEEIYIDNGRGTTFWIVKKDPYQPLIQEMKDYAKGF
jgi:hypothetical protein